MPALSIVVPCFNEEACLPALHERLSAAARSAVGEDYEIVFVNDGSRDGSAAFIEAWIKENHRIKLIEFSRNFGHQPAITAGLHETNGDAVVIIDADLQDPPEKIPEMLEQWKQGFMVVLAERSGRHENVLRKCLFNFFYKLFFVLSDLPVVITSGVFGLMDRKVVTQLLNMEERNRYLPGLRGWLGYKTTTVFYERKDRADGKPRQTLGKLIRYALNAIFSFSYKPLRLSTLIGFFTTIFFFLYGVVLMVMRLLEINVVKGFTTPTVATFLIGGLLLMSNGIIGEYIARIYDEVKKRPLYIIARKVQRKSAEAPVTEES